MISTRRRKAINALALFLIFTMAQVYIQINFAGPNVKEVTPPAPQSGVPLTGKLTTTGGKPVLVNGASLGSGGTILSGATVDVPDGMGATIDLGPLGQLDLAPNTTVEIEFVDGQVKVKIRKGCAILRTKKGTSGEVSTDQGIAATNDRKKDGVADVCFPLGGGSPIVNAGAAANAGAGAGAGGIAGAGGAGGLFGLGPALTATIIGGSVLGTALGIKAARNSNPSPSAP